MKRIFVCSPLTPFGEYSFEDNVRYAEGACKWICDLKLGAPFAPHLLYTRFLDDASPDDRKTGIECGMRFLEVCDELWVFGDHTSSGMSAEIELAQKLGIPVIFAWLSR